MNVVIRVKDLVVKLKSEPILKKVNMEISGKCILLGPNGSGKTTLIKTILGMLNIDDGDVEIDGKSIKEISRALGYVSTNLIDAYTLIPTNLRNTFLLYNDLLNVDLSLANEMLEMFSMSKDVLKKNIWELSTGQRKIVTLILALSSKCRHILLDEPFEDVDPARKKKIIDLLKTINSNVLLSIHETWLLNIFKDWNCYIMISGKAYGPVKIADLLEARIVRGSHERSILTITIGDSTISIVKDVDEGIPISQISTLDRIFEVVYYY